MAVESPPVAGCVDWRRLCRRLRIIVCKIQRATIGQFLAIAALDRVAWRANRRGEFIPDGEHVWRVWCEMAITFTAVAEATIVGAAVAFPCADGRWCLHKIFVAENLRGQATGTRLLAAVLAEIDRIGAVTFLTVDPTNKAAIALYARQGFSEREFVRGYYREGEDRFVLTRPARPAGTTL